MTDSSNDSFLPRSGWQKIMWFGAGFGLLLTIITLLIGVGIVLWHVVDIIRNVSKTDLVFTFSSIGLVTLTLIRILAVLIGAAISFTGLAISFFAYEKATHFSGTINASESTVAKATLATYSPGIVGMIVGAIIIACAIFAKSDFKYEPGQTTTYEPGQTTTVTKNDNVKKTNSQMKTSSELTKKLPE